MEVMNKKDIQEIRVVNTMRYCIQIQEHKGLKEFFGFIL